WVRVAWERAVSRIRRIEEHYLNLSIDYYLTQASSSLREIRNRHRPLGQNGDGRVFADALQFAGDERADVGDRFQMRSKNFVGRDVAVQTGAGFQPDHRQQLRLPLIVHRKSRGEDRI